MVSLNIFANHVRMVDDQVTGNKIETKNPIVFMDFFYKWYKTKYQQLNHIETVKIDMIKNTPYRMDYAKVEEYLSDLKSGGFFSDNYINDYRRYFATIGKKLEKTQQIDGTVNGLDYDIIMHSQEPESYLNNMNWIHLSVVKSNQSSTIVKVKTEYSANNVYQLIYLTKTPKSYLIEKIVFVD